MFFKFIILLLVCSIVNVNVFAQEECPKQCDVNACETPKEDCLAGLIKVN